MKKFENKTVIVTGGAGGIGGSACRRFASEGANVAVFDMNLEAAQKVADEINAAGGKAAAFNCNITDRAQVDAAVAATEAQLGPIDVLVNNAGWDIFKPFTKTVPTEWDNLTAITLTGAFHIPHSGCAALSAKCSGPKCTMASAEAPGRSCVAARFATAPRRFGDFARDVSA